MSAATVTRRGGRRGLFGAGAKVLACLALAGPLMACDTPVYEYALLHWPRELSTVYYVHEGRPEARDAAANALLRKLAVGEEGHANLAFAVVDGRQPDGLSFEVRRMLKATAGHPFPRHVLVSPKGRVVFSGTMAVADVRNLVNSRKTATLADMLARGAQGILVLLTDEDVDSNGRARDAVRDTIRAAREGGQRVGMLELSRQDLGERWLVRQLLAVESDLAQLRGPMVFGVYGRCHATEAYLGKGINAQNLSTLVAFMNGPCTCDIRAQGLGVDLISNRDWGEPSCPGTTGSRWEDPGGYVTFGD